MTIVTNLLLNLLIILISLMGNQFWVESKPQNRFVQRYSLLITSAIAIFFCMTFTFYEQRGIHFDLRRIPFWFGCIYGSTSIGFILTGFTILVRFLQGGEGAITSSLNLVFLFLFILSIKSFYFRQATLIKVFIATGTNILFSLMVLYTFSEIKGLNLRHVTWIEYTVINALGMILVSYFIELIRRNYQLRQKIVHADKLEVMSHLAASVNHEIKNPLTTVRGLVQLFKEDSHSQDVHKQELYQLALNEIDKVESVITDYLTFAKPYPNKIEKINLANIINQSVSIISPFAHQKKTLIQLDEIPEHFLQGDKNLLVQAFVNMLRNSIESMNEGGMISITSFIGKDKIQIHLMNEGTKLNNEKQLGMGEPFFINNTDGTGLELMVVYRIIEGMKGEIDIRYISNQTEIIIFFPL
ncbi:histidine kinase dimerization/phospho-acceptor domain-containing protein [Pseudoneobacillus sp. C159]